MLRFYALDVELFHNCATSVTLSPCVHNKVFKFGELLTCDLIRNPKFIGLTQKTRIESVKAQIKNIVYVLPKELHFLSVISGAIRGTSVKPPSFF